MRRFQLLMTALGGVALLACSATSPGSSGDDVELEGDELVGDSASLGLARSTCESTKVGPPTLARLTQSQTDATLRDIFGLEGWDGVRLSADLVSSVGFTNDASVLVVGGETAKGLLKTAEDVADLVVAQLAAVLPCSASAADRGCVEEFVNQYGHRLFRRPVTSEELTHYVEYQASVASRSDFATGMKWTITAMIQSPHTIYRSEIGRPTGEGRALDDYEMATELAYMLTNSTPDQTLLDLAAAGELSDPQVRRQQAERLLHQDTSKRFLDGIRGFFAEWLTYRRALGMSRDDDPLFAQEISPELVEETRVFLDAVYGYFGTYRDLMTADFSYHNAKLSAFYGWGDAQGDSFVQVSRPPEKGRGILAQGSLLVATSHQTATSPTLRGKLFSNRFLCMETPKPPAVVPTIEETNEDNPGNTTREKYEVNHANPESACGKCHAHFEPWGYTFEAFDEMGLHRTTELTENGEFPINTAVNNAPMPDGSVGSFDSLDDVVALVDSSTVLQDCFSGLMAAYMFSGAGGENCLAEEARAAFAAGDLSIYDYLLALVEAPHFSQRR